MKGDKLKGFLFLILFTIFIFPIKGMETKLPTDIQIMHASNIHVVRSYAQGWKGAATDLGSKLKQFLNNEKQCGQLISDGNFADIWRLEMEQEQFHIWKDVSLKFAQLKIEGLTRDSVIEDDLSKLQQANTIVDQFVGMSPHAELLALLTSTHVTEQQRLRERDGQLPQDIELAVLRRLGNRLWGTYHQGGSNESS